MKPAYQIKTYTGITLDHTIASYSGTADALSIYYKEILTSGVGHFSFTLPSVKGRKACYDDIAINDLVSIWLQDGSVSGNANFIGRVGKITSTMTDRGWIRTISGLSQGEVLLRRFKTNKFYDAVGASTIVTEWAGDLGLGAGDIAADATPVSLEVKTKNYFDLMQFVSDYWVNAGTQLKKDFLVNLSGNLLFKDRPLRTVGVETLTEGQNILSYSVDKLVEKVKNYITVYGSPDAPLPRDKDSYTESTTDWTALSGTMGTSATKKLGNWSVACTSPVASSISEWYRTLPVTNIRTIKQVNFWVHHDVVPAANGTFRIYAPDNANYFEYRNGYGNHVGWAFKTFDLGPEYVYDAVENENGIWTETGSPNWWDMEGVYWYVDWGMVNKTGRIDVLYFYPDRWSNNTSSAASVTSYGQRDLEVTDDKLHTDSDCEKRSETLLYQLKDAPTQIIMDVVGNSNILVGDRLTITLANEGISAASYDVVAVEQMFDPGGWLTRATMVDSANTREEMETTPVKTMRRLHKQIRELGLTEFAVR